MTTKKCKKCGVDLPATTEYFYADKRIKRGGLLSRCKKCQAITDRRWRQEHPEKTREYARDWYAKHPEEKRAMNRRDYAKHSKARKERARIWQKEHQEQVRQKNREWAARHPEKKREHAIKYRVEHREEINARARAYASKSYREKPEKRQRILEYGRRYSKSYPEIRATSTRKREALKHSVPGTHTVVDIQAQYKRQKGRCYYAACGHCKLGDNYHVDHVVPLTRKGSRNDMSNIVLACPSCNLKKNNKLPHEWIEGGRLL